MSNVIDSVPRNAERRIAHIDALRAAAVLLVVVMHAGLTAVPGDGGVVLFFVVSGYIITTLLISERNRTGGFALGSFYVRRAIKLLPPLLVIVVVPTLVYGLFRPVSWSALGLQVGFGYNWLAVLDPAASTQILPGTEVVWSLAIEEQFYIGFALLWVALVHLRRWRGTLAVVTVAVIVWSFLTRLLITLGQPDPSVDRDASAVNHVLRGTDARIESIAWGVLLAVALDAWRRGSLPWLSVLGRDAALLAAVVLMPAASLLFRDDWSEPTLRITAQSLVAVVIIGYGLMPRPSPRRRVFDAVCTWRPIQVVGLASYSIYLVHHPLILVLRHFLEDQLPPVALFTLSCAVGIAAGVVVYQVLEVPVARLKQTWQRPRTGRIVGAR